jgi:membrane protease YdiL (CAAX protease family)
MGYERRSLAGWITAVAVVIAVASYILALPIGILDMITSPDLGVNLANLNGNLGVYAFLLAFETPLIVNVIPLVVLSLGIFGICFAKAATSNGGFRAGIRLLVKGSRPRSLPNWLAVMPIVASSLFIIVLLLTLIQTSVGVSTGSISCSPSIPAAECNADLFAGIITAPVAEEFGFRISVLGLVVGILVAVRLRRNRAQGSTMTTRQAVGLFFASFLSPGYAKERAGIPSVKTSGLKGISKIEWIFLFITAAVFGAYHIFGGGGWGPGKFASAALSGFVLGLVYLAYGAFADILLHWFFNFYFEVYIISTPFNGILGPIGLLNALGCIALGAWGILLAISWLVNRKHVPIVPSPVPSTVTFGPAP